jgi:ATP adenylyltransferase
MTRVTDGAKSTTTDTTTETPDGFTGEPDGFERLWTPHRMVYIKGDERPPSEDAGPDCPFCRAPGKPDDEALIVHRGTEAYAVLNLFPYNPGHVLICPYRHVAGYTELTTSETAEVAALSQVAMRVITAVAAPHGFNLGLNQGSVAGAGIAAHLHQHVVPRWGGDANFLPVVARTKALPELLSDTRARMAAAWTDYTAHGS